MKCINYFLFITLVFFVAAGISGCSQEEQSKAESNKPATAEPVSVTMYKNPNCQCCERWVAYMEENGYAVTTKPSDQLASIKQKNRVPNNLAACHTALVDGYVVEGHVPVEAVNKLLKERPDVKGIAVPGMPTGAPGTTGDRSPVEVYFFNGSDQIAFFDKF
jgi:hypothetical protein